MEVLVLVDFEASMGDELTVKIGDVVKNVTKATDEGWLQGELQGKRGIFPSNFVKEIPVYLMGDSKREPRSIRKTKKGVQTRKCEVAFPYSPQNEDELELVVGEILEIIREIEDGWWMGLKQGKVGAFPSNFVKEIFVSPKDAKQNEGKARPKLSDAMFTKEISQRASVRNKTRNSVEYCQVMFDYKAKAADELEMKKGDVVAILNKETEDEGWWEGELKGRRGFFPDNFVMVLPPTDSLQYGRTSQPPARGNSIKGPGKTIACFHFCAALILALGLFLWTGWTVVKSRCQNWHQEPQVWNKQLFCASEAGTTMEKNEQAKTKEEKPEHKDLRSNPPTKVKLPTIKPTPPPVKEKPNKLVPISTNGDAAPTSPKPQAKEGDQFDGMDVQTEKLSHPTANRAKPPQRRPPTALSTTVHTQSATDETDAEPSDKLPSFQKVSEILPTLPAKPEVPVKIPIPVRPAFPKNVVGNKTANHRDEEPIIGSLQAEIKELRMALELLQTRHERDMQEVKEELKEERNRRLALQEEVSSLKAKH
ncbi:PREDICTED: SH3 domain-containing protein 21 [Cyprinodon variegatus]|uniref:SH3 domain-containing protein 21 n=1 Tax=Cyprinodon variegatus TaxID=28743 RepID=UPI000742ADA0|nr:PREDICTED: SH3 domain-containing protein 21 [Cyprinodon variegatus]